MADPKLQAFSQNFVRAQRQVYGYIVSQTPNRSDAEDLFQKTSLTMWEKWEQYDPESSFFHWACAIAHNHIRNFRRTSRRRHLALPDDLADTVGAAHMAAEGQLEARRDALQRCLEQLPNNQRQLVHRRYAHEGSLSDLAGEMGLTANALYKSIGRIRQALHDCINRRLQMERDS
ncbi:sigma-70 family RNA polymerase sigma factor [Planctomycetales bacterium ZRK34]|nr:sigma-70 family RNA polymerase sigma factor [Planctomycetales bacterium ZRK34]